MKPLMPVQGIIVEKNNRLEAQRWLVEQLASDGGTSITGPHDCRGPSDALHRRICHPFRALAFPPIA
jgi:hypothetical protein